MACLEMYNSEHKGAHPPPPPPMSPRISFSNDFAESHSQTGNNTSGRGLRSDAPISTDFEFNVPNKSLQLSAADELFFKGRILPPATSTATATATTTTTTTTTLRAELLAGDDEDEDEDIFSFKPPQNKGRWKGLLSLRKSHIGSKKTDLPPHRSFSEPSNFFSFPLQDHHPPTPPQGF